LTQDVTEIVQAEAMGKLTEDHRDDMAPVGEGAGVTFGVMLTPHLGDQVGRNQVADLMESMKHVSC
jgi:hypothetical protein